MKKTIAIFIAVMLMVSCLPFATYAAESNEMIPVVVKTPESWGTPNLWAWADDGTNAFAAWPGEQMKVLAEGWYYIYVPSYVQNVIVNANQGTDNAVQTEGVVVEAGKEVWVTVAEDKSATVSYDAQLRGDIPAYVEEFTVHAYVPLSWKTVNIWAWSAPDGTNAFDAWPGISMTEGDDGWFTGKAPTWINSLIINGNDGTVQTADISVEGKELWITVYEDLTYELSYEDPDKAVEPITVHAQVPADWAQPHCWAWSAPDGTNAFTSWPGEALTEAGDWYVIEVPGWINSVIINANDGTIQTGDLSVDAGKDIWLVITDKDTVSISYEEPTGTVTPPADDKSDDGATNPSQTEPQPTEPVNNGENESNNAGLIIGIVAAVIVAAAVVVIVIRKKKH